MSDSMGYENIEVRQVEKHTRLDTARQTVAIKENLLDAQGQIIPGGEITVKVPTGRVMVSENGKKRYGEDEQKDRKAFVQAAKDLGVSARIEATYLANNVTSLRVWLEAQRTFTEEADALRTLALIARLDRNARAKHHSTPSPETEAKVKQHSASLATAIKEAQRVNTEKTKKMLTDIRVRNPWAFPSPEKKAQPPAAK